MDKNCALVDIPRVVTKNALILVAAYNFLFVFSTLMMAILMAKCVHEN